MFDPLVIAMSSYLDFYCRYFTKQWHDMTPTKYGMLLIAIGVIGFIMMKSSNRR